MAASGRPTAVDPRLLRKQHDSILAACRFGDSVGLQALIDKDSSSLNCREEQRNAPPLHLAAEGHHTEVVSILLQNKVDVDAIDNKQLTALHLAARKGFGDIVRLLLAAGATPDPRLPVPNLESQPSCSTPASSSTSSKTATGKKAGAATPSSSLIRHCGIECSPIIIRTPLFVAARKDRAKIVSLLISAGADPNIQQPDFRTPLLIAAAAGLTKTVVALLESPRINVECALPTGVTPLLAAIIGDHQPVVELLLAKGADTHASITETGETSLHLAASRGYAKIVAALLKVRGCPKHQLDRKGNTPLDLAALAGHNKVVVCLTNARAERHITQKTSAALRKVKLPSLNQPAKPRTPAVSITSKRVDDTNNIVQNSNVATELRQRYLILAVALVGIAAFFFFFFSNRLA